MQYIERLLHLEEGEKIIRIVRRSKIILLFPIVLAAFLLWLPFALFGTLIQFGTIGTIIFFVLVGLGILYCVRVFVICYFNVFVITNQRLIDIDQQGLFYRGFSEAPFSKIRDVHFRQSGLFESILGHGRIEVLIEGTNIHLELRSIRHPKEIWRLLRLLIQKYHNGGIATVKEKSYTIYDIKDQLGELTLEEVEELARQMLGVFVKIRKRLGKERFRKILHE